MGSKTIASPIAVLTKGVHPGHAYNLHSQPARHHEGSCWAAHRQAARYYAAAVKLGPVTPALRSEAAAVEGVRANLEAGNAALEADPRQAQWYAGLAERLSGPGLEPAQMLRCKVRSSRWAPYQVLLFLTNLSSIINL